MDISMVSKRYCQLIIFLTFITLQGWLFMRASDCLELESAFTLMLFLLWTPELPSASKQEFSGTFDREGKSLFSSMTLWRFWSVSRTQEVNNSSICSTCTFQSEPLKWAVKPTALRKDFPLQPISSGIFPHWKFTKVKMQWTKLQHIKPYYLILVTSECLKTKTWVNTGMPQMQF